MAPGRSSCTDAVWGPGTPGPSLGNRWFTKKYQGDTSIKKERCVYSMISTDEMHIHRMKVKPVTDSRVWPTRRHQRCGVEWVLMARVTSPRAPIIKFKKKGGGRGRGCWLGGWAPSRNPKHPPHPLAPSLKNSDWTLRKEKATELGWGRENVAFWFYN